MPEEMIRTAVTTAASTVTSAENVSIVITISENSIKRTATTKNSNTPIQI